MLATRRETEGSVMIPSAGASHRYRAAVVASAALAAVASSGLGGCASSASHSSRVGTAPPSAVVSSAAVLPTVVASPTVAESPTVIASPEPIGDPEAIQECLPYRVNQISPQTLVAGYNTTLGFGTRYLDAIGNGPSQPADA